VDGKDALEKVTTFRPAIVITDLVMPRMDGLALLRALQRQGADVTTLLLTAQGTVETAVEAMKEGAYDYLTKPIDLQRLKILLDKIVERLETLREVKALRRQLREQGTFGPLIGNSPEMQKIYQVIEQAAPTSASVLITGESGTGKELVAHAIHANSDRAERPFIKINSAAFPESLFEAELFGYERGAFTGAVGRKKGRLDRAQGGTLFLDEIGDLPLSTQVKLLRVLQAREYERLGGTETLKADVRLIAATNKDVVAAVANGTFREDLYYRLNVFTITLPPLRDRREDLPALAKYFLDKHSREHRRDIHRIASGAMDALAAYAWPGNVREFENAIERAIISCKGTVVEESHLPKTIRGTGGASFPGRPTLAKAVQQLERQLISDALREAGGNLARTSRMLGTTERVLVYKVNKYGLRGLRERSSTRRKR
jgi:DNA-binding NtrC family response regulator